MKFWPFKPKIEKREANFTQLAMNWRAASLSGAAGIADLTATVQSCVSLWENGLSLADVQGTPLLGPRTLALIGRSLALTGEALFLQGDSSLIPVESFDVSTKDGRPIGYRLTLPDTAGGRSVTALAGEALHFRIGCTMATPWAGTAPLRRASLTAGLLDTLERALSDIYADAPLGSQVMPRPEDPSGGDDDLAQSFRGRRGRVLLPESVNVTAAGGATPSSDWKPSDLTPDLSRSELTQTAAAARAGIMAAFGVLPALLADNAQGPLVREAQRHLAQWTLTPIATQIAAETTAKLGTPVQIDVSGPLRAFDAGGRARSLKATIDALAAAKAAGIDPAAVLHFAGVKLD